MILQYKTLKQIRVKVDSKALTDRMKTILIRSTETYSHETDVFLSGSPGHTNSSGLSITMKIYHDMNIRLTKS